MFTATPEIYEHGEKIVYYFALIATVTTTKLSSLRRGEGGGFK